MLNKITSLDYEIFAFNSDGSMRQVSLNSVQEIVWVDYFCAPKEPLTSRSHPAIRNITLNQRLEMIEHDIEHGDWHRWHVAEIIDRFELENGADPRIDAIRARVRDARDKLSHFLSEVAPGTDR